jgi:rod shape determining protein RodA
MVRIVEANRRVLRDIDWVALLVPLALGLIGCVGIYSVAPSADHWKKHLASLLIGIVAAAAAALADYRKVLDYVAPAFYLLMLILLVLVLTPLGATINGNRAWLRLGGLSLQPSEFAKLATIMMLARYLGERHSKFSLKDAIIMAGVVALPAGLVQMGSDTGTMLTFGAILGAFYFFGGMPKRVLAGGFAALVIGLVVGFPHLKEYQKQRIMAVIEPEKVDPRGFGYQTIQSKIAVGSGGLFGKGIAQEASQGRLGFLPYAYSDFIAAVIAEDAGFIGVLLVIGLYLVLVWRLISIARSARDQAGALAVLGFASLLVFHIVCNLGMVVGSLPIMGIPLPPMSAGGTSVVATFAGIGLALSVRLRRFVN